MPTSMPDPESIRKWRMKAAELRAYADSTKDPSARDTYVKLARTWEEMAERAEQLARTPEPPKL